MLSAFLRTLEKNDRNYKRNNVCNRKKSVDSYQRRNSVHTYSYHKHDVEFPLMV